MFQPISQRIRSRHGFDTTVIRRLELILYSSSPAQTPACGGPKTARGMNLFTARWGSRLAGLAGSGGPG